MSQPFEFFSYQNGTLTSENVSLAEIAAEVGTPVYIYSSQAFLDPLKQLQKGLEGMDSLICFALKSNSNIAVLKLLAQAGAGMDLVSGGELYRAEKAGVPGHQIVFSGVGKTESEMIAALRYGKNQGIHSFNIESIEELVELNRVAKSLKVSARVAFRFNPDVDAKTHPYISTGLKKNKFGLQKKEILQITRQLRELSAIRVKGISIHIGSQLRSLAPLEDSFKRLSFLVQEMNGILDAPLEFVDLGGGLGITYKNEKIPKIEKYCALIRKYFGKSDLQVLLEPGRTIAGNAGVLVSRVLYRKNRKTKDFLVIDAGMNDLIRPALYGSYHEIVPLNGQMKNGQVKKGQTKNQKLNLKLKKTNVVGPVCESADCFASDRLLPESLKGGDFLALLSSGAYGFSMASQYNSRPRPAEVLIQNGNYEIVRCRENYEDLIRGEWIPDEETGAVPIL